MDIWTPQVKFRGSRMAPFPADICNLHLKPKAPESAYLKTDDRNLQTSARLHIMS